MPINRTDPAIARQVIDRLLPDPRSRKVALEFLAGAIQHAHSLRPDRWGVTLQPRLVRLNVGKIETMVLYRNLVRMVFHAGNLPAGLGNTAGISWSEDGKTIYGSVAGSCLCHIAADVFPSVSARIELNHRDLIARAASTSPNPRTAIGHAPGVLRYLETELGIAVPNPGNWQAGSGERHASAEALQASADTWQASAVPDVEEELLSAPEGRRRWQAHFRIERSKALVEAKKARVLRDTQALACEACGFDFAAFYGPSGNGFCEVHHRIALADREEGTETNLDNLAILCANCHRVIHRKSPMPTVEEFREMLPRR